MTASESVYIGAWINWTNGPIQGATLTLPNQTGSFLIAFLALFVRISGDHLWETLCRLLFLSKATTTARDGLHHQHQAILRNSSSDENALWQFIRVGWAWRRKARGLWKRSLVLAVVALLHIAAFGAAGIFSANVKNNNSEVLLRSSLCGVWSNKSAGNPYHGDYSKFGSTTSDEFNTQSMDDLLNSAAYVSTCFNSSLGGVSCTPIGRQQNHFSLTENVTCPFQDGMCRNNTAIRLDTGPIDSHMDFGINTRPKDRITLRRVMDCAPLVSDGFRSGIINDSAAGIDAPQGFPGEKVIQYSYGQLTSLTQRIPGLHTNATYVFRAWTHTNTSDPWPIFGVKWKPYFVVGASVAHLNWVTDFTPIPQLNRTDADVILLALSFENGFTSPVKDPWFTSQMAMENYGVTYYSSSYEDPLSFLGCALRQEICNPTNSICTSLTGQHPSYLETDTPKLGLNDRQSVVLRRLRNISGTGIDLDGFVNNLGSHSMLAERYIGVSSMMTPVPDNHWILELSNWFNMMMSATQLRVSSFVTGPSNPASQAFIVPPPENATWMCDSQIVQRNDYASFSILGLVIVLVVGTLFIVVNISLDAIIHLLGTKTGKGHFRQLEWMLSGTLQLQRMTYEGRGLGNWSNVTDFVPTTVSGEEFGLPSTTLPDALKAHQTSTWSSWLTFPRNRSKAEESGTSSVSEQANSIPRIDGDVRGSPRVIEKEKPVPLDFGLPKTPCPGSPLVRSGWEAGSDGHAADSELRLRSPRL